MKPTLPNEIRRLQARDQPRMHGLPAAFEGRDTEYRRKLPAGDSFTAPAAPQPRGGTA